MLKRVRPLPEIREPLAREIMGLVAESHLPWWKLEASAGAGTDTVRLWFYRTTWNPGIKVVIALLRVLGYRLAIVPLAEGEGD
jgi:hypothetical protein